MAIRRFEEFTYEELIELYRALDDDEKFMREESLLKKEVGVEMELRENRD